MSDGTRTRRDYLPFADASAETPFVLDQVENPHPKMLAGALRARRDADPCPALPEEVERRRGYWQGYLAAMADATGCDPADLEAWMDRHQ